MSYATPNDMTTYFDERAIRDLASDTGKPCEDLANDVKLLAILTAASGEVDASLTVANQYTPTQLGALTGGALELLKELTCALAFGRLLRRRPGNQHEETYKASAQWALDLLEELRKGHRVFGGATEQQSAGLVSITGPTAVTFGRLNLIRDRTDIFPARRIYTP